MKTTIEMLEDVVQRLEKYALPECAACISSLEEQLVQQRLVRAEAENKLADAKEALAVLKAK